MHIHARSKVEQSKGIQSAVEPSPESSNSFFERDFESTSSVKSLRSRFGQCFRALSGFDRLRNVVSSSGQLRSTAGAAFSTFWQLRSTAGAAFSSSRQLRSTAGAAFSTFWQLRSTAGAAFSSSGQLRSTAGAAFSSSWQLQGTAGAAFLKAKSLRSSLEHHFRWFYRANAVPVQKIRAFSAYRAN